MILHEPPSSTRITGKQVHRAKLMSRNEKKTEKLVEKRLQRNGYYADGTDIIVEAQISDSPKIQKLLSNASKKGTGVGRPEFMIRSSSAPEFIMVFECKADPKKHQSLGLDSYADYAVDGVLLYSSFLSKEFDVLAIAVSGQSESELRVSHFIQLKGTDSAVEFPVADDIVSFAEYYDYLANSDIKYRQDYEALLEYSRTLNNELQAKKITEAERAFLISGVLIGLQNSAFKASMKKHKTGKQLGGALLSAISVEFENADLPQDRREILDLSFSFIVKSPALANDLEFFLDLISSIDKNINSFRRTHKFYDIIGQFYIEFLRYANNDKGLGIVLTPPHAADLFAELAEVNKDSVVFDNCCGTGGLLIAAMGRMVEDAGADTKAVKRIKYEGLVGIEFQPKVYALAVSNMILHGDGKTNLFRGDCFFDAGRASYLKPTAGLLNPPYKNKSMKTDREELEFILNNMELLAPGSKCVAIVPITCATAPSGDIADLKRRLLAKHTLEAVMSMPIELFHNSKTNVVTCVMVFTAHKKHPRGKKTWFGYWRDDGFIKTKHLGRYDKNGTWPAIKAAWINAYRNRDTVSGLSVMREVAPTDEWCAEAYLPTDYGAIEEGSLKETAKRYVLQTAMLSHEHQLGQELEA